MTFINQLFNGCLNYCLIPSDEEVPAIYCPAPIFTVTDASQPGAVVTWTVTAQDNSGAEPTIVCVADGGLVSGDEFPIGVTTVTCTATDAASNEASCSFTITVEGKFRIISSFVNSIISSPENIYNST
jgi:hypothetical protein